MGDLSLELSVLQRPYSTIVPSGFFLMLEFRSCLTTRMQKDALCRHACVPHCTQVLYRFCALDRPRKVTAFVPLIEDHQQTNPFD